MGAPVVRRAERSGTPERSGLLRRGRRAPVRRRAGGLWAQRGVCEGAGTAVRDGRRGAAAGPVRGPGVRRVGRGRQVRRHRGPVRGDPQGASMRFLSLSSTTTCRPARADLVALALAVHGRSRPALSALTSYRSLYPRRSLLAKTLAMHDTARYDLSLLPRASHVDLPRTSCAFSAGSLREAAQRHAATSLTLWSRHAHACSVRSPSLPDVRCSSTSSLARSLPRRDVRPDFLGMPAARCVLVDAVSEAAAQGTGKAAWRTRKPRLLDQARPMTSCRSDRAVRSCCRTERARGGSNCSLGKRVRHSSGGEARRRDDVRRRPDGRRDEVCACAR